MAGPLPADLRAAYEAGATQAELAEKYGVARHQIAQWLRRAGAEMRVPGARRLYDGATPRERHRQASVAYRSRARGGPPASRTGLRADPNFDDRVAELLRTDMSQKDIAAALGVSTTTISRSRARIDARENTDNSQED